ncbi:restriction endonuclease subunit S [Fusobacterium polymorphum]
MSRLDELIKELCPNGVEYKKLGEIFNLKNGYTPSKANKEYWENTDINWFRIEDININGGILEDSIQKVNTKGIKGSLFSAKSLIVSTTATIGKHALILKDFICNQQFTCLTIKEDYEKIYNGKFMYYYFFKINELTKKNLKVSSFPSVDMDKFKKFLIPLPPLEIQDEIVRVLDNYTKSVEELKEKLNEELIARKKQYSWYRDYLLKFENKIEIVKLGDIVEVYDGTHQTPDYKKTGIPFISVENIDNIYNTEKYISEEDYEKNYRIKPKIDDIFMTRIGTIGKCAIVTKNNPLAYYVSLALLRPNKNKIDSAYLKYIIESGIGKKELNKRILFTAVPIKINKGDIDKLEIPLPPLEVQKRIVGVLDNFEKICNDLNIGLPAEIEARQKQYEFYRNFLLTFKIENCTLPKTRQDKTRQDIIKLFMYIFGYIELELGEILKIKNGLDYKKFNIGNIPVYGSGGIINYIDTYIYDKESVLIPRKGSIGNLFYVDKPFWTVDTIFYTVIDKDIVIPKYVYYYLSKINLEKLNTAGGVPSLTQTVLNKILIPLPPLEEQRRIVDILDRFDKLCNDISEGLPAEIEARQKQYEYFREKLLTFKNIND